MCRLGLRWFSGAHMPVPTRVDIQHHLRTLLCSETAIVVGSTVQPVVCLSQIQLCQVASCCQTLVEVLLPYLSACHKKLQILQSAGLHSAAAWHGFEHILRKLCLTELQYAVPVTLRPRKHLAHTDVHGSHMQRHQRVYKPSVFLAWYETLANITMAITGKLRSSACRHLTEKRRKLCVCLSGERAIPGIWCWYTQQLPCL